MLKQRVITSIVGLPIVLAMLMYAPPPLLLVLMTGFVAISSYEIAAMLAPRWEGIASSGSLDSGLKIDYPKWILALAVSVSSLVFLGSAQDSQLAGRGMILAGTLASIIFGSFLSENNNQAIGRIFILLVSVCYGAFPWLAAWELYIMKGGAGLIFLIGVVFSGDTGAYFGGKRFGRRKLAPRMSPNKTIEGSLSGVLASVVFGYLVSLAFGGFGEWYVVVVASVLGAVFGQMGDLVESTFKRFSMVKDSGVIFPGHGGFLDRVDGVLFAAPVIWFVLYISEL